MKFIIYISIIVLILSIFTTIECKKTKRIPFFRKNPIHVNSRSNGSNSADSQNSIREKNHPQLKKNEVEPLKKPVSQMSVSREPYHQQQRPTQVTYGPRQTLVSGPRYIGSPRPYGYLRARFPIWLTSYAIVRNSLDECPAYNEDLQFAKRTFGVCVVICDKLHCIQTANYCCYYVEPEKFLIVAS